MTGRSPALGRLPLRAAALMIGVAGTQGCTPWSGAGTEVSVNRQGAAIVFTATRASGEPACFDQLLVSDARREMDHLWALTIDPAGPCVNRVVYGRVPPGAEAEVPARPLRPSGRYLVEVLGSHLLGGERFTFSDRQGSLVNEAD